MFHNYRASVINLYIYTHMTVHVCISICLNMYVILFTYMYVNVEAKATNIDGIPAVKVWYI